MNYEEMQKKILEILPNASFEEDLHGQIVIYTGVEESGDDIVPFDSIEEEEG